MPPRPEQRRQRTTDENFAQSVALVFAALSAFQARALPARHAAAARPAAGRGAGAPSVWGQWRQVASNRPFLLFSAAMTGSYVLTFQVYLALPPAADAVLGPDGTKATSGLFVVSAAVAVAGQLRLTGWAERRFTPHRALAAGLAAMGAAFLPLALAPAASAPATLVALAVSVAVLGAAGAVVHPFETATVVALSGNRLVATHYGLYNTVSGLGITLGNLALGALWDATRADAPWVVWIALAMTGTGCATAVTALARTGRLHPLPAQPAPA
ncbi:MFS transporter [Streptomyces sp. NPDC001744]|uniref:MFS transporter n=1 Tax=Streptomyces sp. NPDC001744 TaxID=3364606 RepID=UPI0036C3B68D